MDIKKLQSRDTALDIIRITAVFTVLSVHFFLHNGFYSQTVMGTEMYIMVLMRTLFSVCVPMFLTLTGYLMCHKTLSKKYYSGITKTLIVFVLATFACMIFKTVHNGDPFSFKLFLLGTLDFTGANYSWYIEMYIGLFLLAPFLNLAYNKLKNKRQKQVLVLTLVFLTIVPTIFNIFNFDTAVWWSDPKTSDTFAKLVPSWWMGFYPVTYYFTGCYLREYGIKLKTRSLFILFIAAIFLFGTFNYFRSYGTTFKSGIYVYWYGFEPFILSTFLFVLLSRIKTDKLSDKSKFVLWKISDLALGIYLISFIFDSLIYAELCRLINPMTDRLPFYIVTVPLVFVCSAAASAIMNFAAKYIQIFFRILADFIKKQRQRADKYIWQDYIFVALMALGLILSFWKCSYGFGGNDEPFYLTIPHRLIMGDSLIGDEWHLSQLSGIFLMPFVGLYTFITGGTEGIIFAARIMYVILHCAVSVFVYTRLRKYGYLSVFASVLYFIFTPYNIMAMSYNTMGLDFVTITGVIMGTIGFKKKAPIIISGLTFAAAVLCCPYLAFGYLLYIICVLIHKFIKNKNTNFVLKSELFAGKTFLFFSIGIFALAALFMIFLLSRISVGDIIKNIPYMLLDPEHPSMPVITKLRMYFNSIINFHSHFYIALYSYLAMIIVMIFDKKRKLHRSVYLIVTTAIVIFCYILILPQLTSSYYNAIMFPLIFIGITSYILCEKKPKEIFISIFALGIVYTFAGCFGSNQYFYFISMAMASINLASYVFLAQLIREMRTNPDNIEYAVWVKRGSFLFAAFMIFLQGAFQLTSKINHCFWESGDTTTLTSQIATGPAKGIYTNPANYVTYEKTSSDLDYYKNKEKDNILFLTYRTWCYLKVNDFPYGTYSAWLSVSNPTVCIDRLNKYYTLNPDKKPEYVYIPKDSDFDFSDIYNAAGAKGYSVTENDISYKLEKIN